MHADITASVRWAIAGGIADPTRVCIVGWSYGGYAALTGAIKEPQLYRCAVSIAGVSDLVGLQQETARFYGDREAVRESLGNKLEELKQQSPVRNAGRITVPVLLVHGDDDIQVLVDHSRDMARALARAGRRHELVIVKDGDHSLSRPEWRLIL